MRTEAEELQATATRHLRWGWTLLALFVVLGIVLKRCTDSRWTGICMPPTRRAV